MNLWRQIKYTFHPIFIYVECLLTNPAFLPKIMLSGEEEEQ